MISLTKYLRRSTRIASFCSASEAKEIETWREALSPDERTLLDELQTEYASMKLQDTYLPTELGEDDWRLLLQVGHDKKAFIKQLKIFFQRERKQAKLAEELRTKVPVVPREKGYIGHKRTDFGHLRYAMYFNTLFIQFTNTRKARFYDTRVLAACINHQDSLHIMFDLSTLSTLPSVDHHRAASQLRDAITANRRYRQPFRLHFVGVDFDAEYWRTFTTQYFPDMDVNCDFLLNITSAAATELFDKQKLVYISPNAKTVLESQSNSQKSHSCNSGDTATEDIMYVFGAVTENPDENLILQQFLTEGIRCRKLPADETTKNVTLDTMLKVLYRIRESAAE